MERAPKTEFVYADETLVGVFLKGDSTAQHECGIDRLKQRLGINREPDQFGIEHRRAKFINETVGVFYEGKKYALLLVVDRWKFGRYKELMAAKTPMKKILDWLDLRFYRDEVELAGAWDDRNFAIAARTKPARQQLKQVYQALVDGDLCVMTGGGSINPFDRGGLALGIISNIPQEIKDDLHEADKDAYELDQAAKATGIYDIIHRSNYFALSPRWVKEMRSADDWKDTKHPVVFWLNPHDQRRNASGYFSVEELTAWIRGEAEDGPIANRGGDYKRQQRLEDIHNGDSSQLWSEEIYCRKCRDITKQGRYGRCAPTKCGICGGNGQLVLPDSRTTGAV